MTQVQAFASLHRAFIFSTAINTAITSTERVLDSVSRFCIASLLAMVSLWVIAAKHIFLFVIECARLACIYCQRQLAKDIVIVVTVAAYCIRIALESDEFAFIKVAAQSAAVLYDVALEVATLNLSAVATVVYDIVKAAIAPTTVNPIAALTASAA